MKKIAPFLLLVILIASCSDLKKRKQLDHIDQLSNSLDSIEVVLLSNKIDSLQQMQALSNNIMEEITENYQSDTISLAFGKKMDSYKQMILSFPIIIEDQVTLNTNITTIRKSLSELKEDISAANGKRNQYDEYIAFETKKLDSVRTKAKEYMVFRDKLIAHFKQTHTEMDNYSKFLIKKNPKSVN